ncbi:unnamed protein product [Adineta steineri]|uniref:VWFA domain-containing protein n=1 Tax=Adineta steineri TaxID=433720 RepID=A0A819V555_9BILA|nr:unnamed protein product [Adineta steineri]CAF4099498.1 unnamed protein product [Adineta steineri]
MVLSVQPAAINNDTGISFQSLRQDGRCDRLIDLYLVLDSSGSIPQPVFQQAKEAMKEIIQRLDVGPKKVMVTVVNYGSTVEVPVELASIPITEITVSRILTQIDNIKYIGSGTATGDALWKVYERCVTLKKCRDLHFGASRTILVFTDGQSNTGRPILAAKTDLFVKGKAEIFAVGIGNGIQDAELLTIATNEKYVRHFKDYVQLLQEINFITLEACGIPAFVVPNVRVSSEVEANDYRFYQLDTKELITRAGNSNTLGGYVEITANIKKGDIAVFTSSSDPNPKAGTSRRASWETRAGGHYYLEYIEHDSSRLYFSFLGADLQNEYDFEVRWLDMNGNIVAQIG